MAFLQISGALFSKLSKSSTNPPRRLRTAHRITVDAAEVGAEALTEPLEVAEEAQSMAPTTPMHGISQSQITVAEVATSVVGTDSARLSETAQA